MLCYKQYRSFSSTLDLIAPIRAPTRGARPRIASKTTIGTLVAILIEASPATGPTLVSRNLLLELPRVLHNAFCLPNRTKENNLPRIRPRKEKQSDDASGPAHDIQQGSIIADTRREARRRYTSFAIINNFRGRVVNIEDSFDNLPHRICLPIQYMNESVTTEE